MRITELFEGNFNDLDFIKKEDNRSVLDYDLCEDLVFFMNHNDDVYRRDLYPAISQFLQQVKSNRRPSPSIFAPAVISGYNKYIEEFPIKELPESLDKKLCDEICTKLHDGIQKDFEEGKYKD